MIARREEEQEGKERSVSVYELYGRMRLPPGEKSGENENIGERQAGVAPGGSAYGG